MIKEEKELKEAVVKFIEDNNYKTIEIDADYRDELDNDAIGKITQSDNPKDALHDFLWESYSEQEWEETNYVYKECLKALEEDWDLDDEEMEFVRDVVNDNVCVNIPEQHFLNQTVDVTAVLDVGDANYEWTNNAIYPAYYSNDLDSEDDIDDESGLAYLTEKQGYSKKDLFDTIKRMDASSEKIDYKKSYPFLESVYVELLNSTSSSNAVTFLLKMTLEELINVIQEGKKDKNYEITIPKDTRCGLVDYGNGGGSILDINLEKDMKIPFQNFWHYDLDTKLYYGINSIYGDFPA